MMFYQDTKSEHPVDAHEMVPCRFTSQVVTHTSCCLYCRIDFAVFNELHGCITANFSDAMLQAG